MRAFTSLLCISALVFSHARSSAAETITVFDAAFLVKDMRNCHIILRNNPDEKRQTFNAPPTYHCRLYCEEVRKKGTSSSFDRYFPLGCGGDHLDFVTNYSDCPTVGLLNTACVKELQIMTQADVEKIQKGFTRQLDDWLKMLENAGAITLDGSTDDSGAEP